MRISEIIKCASDLAELEKQAMVDPKLITSGINFVRSGAKVAPKFSGRLNQGSKLFAQRIANVPTRINSTPVAQINPRIGAAGGNSLRAANPPAVGSLSISDPVNSTSLGLSKSLERVGGEGRMLINNPGGMTAGVRGATAGAAAPTATEAVESAAKASLLDRLKGMSPGMKTGLTVGGAGLAGGGLGAWMNSGSGYEDAMNDAQLMMMNQQRQYEEALGRMQNRGLFDRIMNTGG